MAIRPKTVVQLKARGDCPSHSKAEVTIRDTGFVIDEPAERGGTNQGPAPTETALAALIGCTNTIGHKCARALGFDIGDLSMDLTCDFDRRGVTLAEEIALPFVAIRLTVRASGAATEDQLRTLAHEVEKFCPLSKLFRAAGTDVRTIWTKA